MNKTNWELKVHTQQIADTGDYDSHIELKNEVMSLITREDNFPESEGLEALDALNKLGVKWENWIEDDLRFQIDLGKDQLEKIRFISAKMYTMLHKIHNGLVVPFTDRDDLLREYKTYILS